MPGASAVWTSAIRSGRDAGDVVRRQMPRQHVEAVEDHADPLVPGALDRVPGLAVVVDVAAPGERLEADPDVELRRELAQLVQVGRDALHPALRLGRDAAADEQERRAEPAHQLELAPRPLERLGARRLRQALEIAKRLQRDDLEPERGRERLHVLRPAVEIGQVVLEQLDALKARLGRGRELLAQRSRHADRGDRSLHLSPPASAGPFRHHSALRRRRLQAPSVSAASRPPARHVAPRTPAALLDRAAAT